MLHRLRATIRNLLFRKRVETSLEDELDSAVEILAAGYARGGADPREARRRALVELGGRAQVKEQVRLGRRGALIAGLLRDMRIGGRMLLGTPGFTAMTLLTLTLGIGGVTAVYSVVHAVLLQPLPYGEPGRLVRVEVEGPRFVSWDVPPELDWPGRQRVFEDLFSYEELDLELTDGPEVRALAVPRNFTRVLRVEPALGRSFSASDSSEDPPTVVLLNYSFWRGALGGDPGIVGRRIETGGGGLTVLGVMPAGFRFEPLAPEPADLWVLSVPEYHEEWIARLRPGVAEDDAVGEMTRIVEDMEAEYPGSDEREVTVLSLVDAAVGADWRRALMLFLGAVTLVLVIAVANTANLMLARGIGREHEMAVRSVVGSTRSQLLRHLLIESLLVGVLGGAGGVLLARLALGWIVSGLPPQLPRLEDIAIDGGVLVFALAAALLSGLAFGILPALSVSLPRFDHVLKEGSRTATESRWRRRLRSGLVASEVALAMVLLTGGLLLARSFVELVGTPLGMNIENVIAAMPELPGYDRANRTAFLEEIADRLEARPDVEAVSPANMRGMAVDTRMAIEVDGQLIQPRSMEDLVPTLVANADVFEILGIPIASGRAFEEGESAAVVSESFVEKFFPGRNPLEQEIGGLAAEPLRIVGVVPDFRLAGLDTASEPAILAPVGYPQYSLLVRVRDDPAPVMSDIQTIVREMDPEVVVSQTTLVDSLYASDAVSDPQFRTTVLGAFAAVALTMGLAGISGVTAYTAARRRQEVGIRIALGATRTRIVIQMLRQAMTPVFAGVFVGMLGALGLTRLISGYLYEVSPTDPIAFALAALILTVTALVAACLPLTRATAVEPVTALRHQ